MSSHCQMVMGPAGTGKTTYCRTIQEHCAAVKRTVHIVNLDPAADELEYEPAFDVRDLITVEDVMEELELGPNGGLIYCMEYLMENIEWFKEQLEPFLEGDYLLFDCPGQIELYSHIPVMKEITKQLQRWDFRVAGVYLIDATFLAEPTKFISGSLCALSNMAQLELPHVNVLSKCDLAEDELVESPSPSCSSLSCHVETREKQQAELYIYIYLFIISIFHVLNLIAM